jgi:lipid II:glycine glycyltransferase (peptidoglycan interpeptide bridge formation enzyme)
MRVRTLSRDEHLRFIEEYASRARADRAESASTGSGGTSPGSTSSVSTSSVSFLQCPSWGDLKTDWRAESVGWIDDATGEVVGAGLVLYRDLPIPKRDKLPFLRRSLAYLPEGPILDLTAHDAGVALKLLVGYLRERGAFTVKIGPQLVTRRWGSETIKKAIAAAGAVDGGDGVGGGGEAAGGQAAGGDGNDGDGTGGNGTGGKAGGIRLKDIEPDYENPEALRVIDQLRAAGWTRKEADGAGFGDFQPRYVFQLPLADAAGEPRSLDAIQKGFNQLWRRNIKKADKSGVEVSLGSYEDLAAFHDLYKVTAVRDHFTPRPLAYFQRMWTAMEAEDPNRIRLYLARHDGDLLAATTLVTVGGHAWYSYGASADHKRELRPSNAIQWRMLSDAHAAGAKIYDLRGISDTLDPADHLFGLIQFKLGTGGQAVEYLGEWDHPINRVLHRAFEMYLARR